MPDRSPVKNGSSRPPFVQGPAYRSDGSFEGLLCCVHESVYTHELPVDIQPEEAAQPTLFRQKYIAADEEKAARVYDSIPRKISPDAAALVQCVFLSCMPGKELAILRFLLLGYLSLAALPIWAGGLSLIMAIYFLIASANMAAICYVALVLALPPLLDTLGKHISPFFQLLHHLTLSYQLDLLLNVQILDWALIGRCWLVGLGWTAAATALGLFCFSRRELP